MHMFGMGPRRHCMSFLVVIMLFIIPSLVLASEGYWKFSEVVTNRSNYEPKDKKGDRFVTYAGGTGFMMYREERHPSQGEYEFGVTMSWGDIPKILVPGEVYKIELQASVSTHVKPEGTKVDLLFSQGFGLQNTGATAKMLKGLPRGASNFKVAMGAVNVGVKIQQKEEQVAVLTAPDQALPNQTKFGIRAASGQARAFCTVDYLYTWEVGVPSEADLLEMVPREEPPDTVPQEELPRPDTGMWWDRPTYHDRSGHVPKASYVRGDVQVLIGETWKPFVRGMEVPIGAEVKTGPGASAEVILGNNSIIRVKPGSSMLIPEIDTLREEKVDLLSMIAGKIWLKMTKGEDFSVQTSCAIAGVRGTVFTVEVKENGSEKISCYSGEIIVTPTAVNLSPGDRVRAIPLRAGETMGFAPRGQVLSPRPLTEIEKMEFLLMACEDPGTTELIAGEREGKSQFNQQTERWHLEVFENQGKRHGILFFDGVLIRDPGMTQLPSPFGVLIYHGHFNDKSKEDTGWLPR